MVVRKNTKSSQLHVSNTVYLLTYVVPEWLDSNMDRSVTDDPPFKLWYNHCFLKQHSTSLISLTRTVLGTTKLELTWKNVLVTKGILFQRQRPRTTPRRCRKKSLKTTMCLPLCWWTYCRSVLSCKRHEAISAPGPWANLPVFFFFFKSVCAD